MLSTETGGFAQSFVQFITNPGVLFALGLVLVVVLAGIFLSRGPLTGRKVLTSTVAFFAVVIAVNVVLANRAIGTFPGLEVQNSYVASQTFDAERAAQEGLGWTLATEYDAAEDALRLAFTDAQGLPAAVKDLRVLVGRTTEANEDQNPSFTRELGVFVAPLQLGQGKWMLHVEATDANGTVFRQRIDLFVKG